MYKRCICNELSSSDMLAKKVAHISIVLGIIFSCLCPVNAISGSYQSHKSIYLAAENFMRKNLATRHGQSPVIKPSHLDSRLKLNKCNKPLVASLPRGSREIGKTTVEIKCPGAKPWSINVPVTISVYKNILVASRTLKKGDILTKEDVRFSKHDLSKLPYGYFDNSDDGIGMELKRRIVSGAVITPSMLKKQQVVKRGQKITIIAESGRMQVRMLGEALDNGAVGDRIKLINLKSRRKLEGVITSSSEVKVHI